MHLDRSPGGHRSHLREGVLTADLSVTRVDTSTADPTPLFVDAGLERGADGLLRAGGVSLEAIAKDVGTPAFVYHAAPIRERYQTLTTAFAAIPHRIHYAAKANSNLAVLAMLGKLGAGADIVSAGELARVLKAGIPADRVVFSGVGKSEAELATAVDARIGAINLESPEELTVLERVVAGRSIDAPVRLGIRVNPDVAAETHPYITTGASGIKFGVPTDQVPGLVRRIAANPRFVLVSLAMHLGSQLLRPEPFARGAAVLVEMLTRLRESGIRTIEALDLGGGLGIRYRDETPLDPAVLAAAVAPVVADAGVSIHLEPGRFLVGSAGVLLTKVLYRKRSGGKNFVIVDAAMTDLVRPSHYQAYHAIVEVTTRGRETQIADVVGPVCETGDFLALDRAIATVEPGEYLAILCAGAYGAVMSSNYNSRPRAAEVVVDRGRYGIARARETVTDLYRGETVDPFTSSRAS